jgi:hypothetical protein
MYKDISLYMTSMRYVPQFLKRCKKVARYADICKFGVCTFTTFQDHDLNKNYVVAKNIDDIKKINMSPNDLGLTHHAYQTHNLTYVGYIIPSIFIDREKVYLINRIASTKSCQGIFGDVDGKVVERYYRDNTFVYGDRNLCFYGDVKLYYEVPNRGYYTNVGTSTFLHRGLMYSHCNVMHDIEYFMVYYTEDQYLIPNKGRDYVYRCIVNRMYGGNQNSCKYLDMYYVKNTKQNRITLSETDLKEIQRIHISKGQSL